MERDPGRDPVTTGLYVRVPQQSFWDVALFLVSLLVKWVHSGDIYRRAARMFSTAVCVKNTAEDHKNEFPWFMLKNQSPSLPPQDDLC